MQNYYRVLGVYTEIVLEKEWRVQGKESENTVAHKPPTQVPEKEHYSINQLQGATVVIMHAKTTLIDV